MFSVIIGLTAGFIHVLSGPDHLAALAPIAADLKQKSFRTGLRWGIGHTLGVIVIGMIALFFQNVFHEIEIVSKYSEKIIGLTLVAIGLWGINRAAKLNVHSHSHEHDGFAHTHFHAHTMEEKVKKDSHFHTHTAILVGTLHGLAGGSHIFGVLPALALPTQFDAIIYLLSFGFGTITAMALFTYMIGFASATIVSFREIFFKKMMIGISSVSILIGIYWFWSS